MDKLTLIKELADLSNNASKRVKDVFFTCRNLQKIHDKVMAMDFPDSESEEILKKALDLRKKLVDLIGE